MITLRSNQVEPIRKAIEFFNSKNPSPSLIVLPTAWGKSILTAKVAAECSDKLIVIQPSKELLEQNYSKYINLCCDGVFCNAGIYSASFGSKDIEQITYATIGSIKNLGAKFKALGFRKVLIDEAHLFPRESSGMLRTFIKEAGITHVLGITATPIKLQSGIDLDGSTYSKLVMLTSRSKKGNFFKDIIHVGQVEEMVRLGFWSKLIYETSPFDGRDLRYNSQKSEYTEESVQIAFERNGGSRRIIKALDKLQDRKHILVFVPSVEEAIQLSEIYPNSGAVHSYMNKKERDKVISDFRSGSLRVIFNVRVLSTGFDYTGIDCIVLGISTASIALYYQILGRATRIDENKKNALILDMCGNTERFGKIEDIRFEKIGKWEMFGSSGKLLSGIKIHEIGEEDINTIKAKLARSEAEKSEVVTVMPFGKHKGEVIKDVPLSYRKWMLDNFDWNSKNKGLKQAIIKSL